MDNPVQKKIEQIAIVPNPEKGDVLAATRELIKWLEDRHVKAVVHEDDAVKMDIRHLAADDLDIQQSGAVVCLGGDGTILRGVRMLKGAAVPVVGINFGRVGFLSEVEHSEIYPAMERVIAGDFTVDERMMLKCTVKFKDFEQEYLALNDITVERGHHMRMLELFVYINDIQFSRYKADGVICATPTGSTAYSFSAGGPVVYPGNELVLITPINPHSLFGRTIVLGAQDKVKVELARRVEATVSIDGAPVFESIADSVSIEKAAEKTHLIKLKEIDFYTVFKNKLNVWDTWSR